MFLLLRMIIPAVEVDAENLYWSFLEELSADLQARAKLVARVLRAVDRLIERRIDIGFAKNSDRFGCECASPVELDSVGFAGLVLWTRVGAQKPAADSALRSPAEKLVNARTGASFVRETRRG